MNKPSFPSVKTFTQSCMNEGILSPTEMAAEYNRKYGLEGKPQQKTSDAFRKALSRLGITPEKRLELKAEAQKETQIKDILENERVVSYFNKNKSRYSKHNLDRTTRSLRLIWGYMNKTNPETWTESEIWEALNKNEPKNSEGQWLYPSRVYCIVSSLSTIFPNILAKGHTAGLVRPKGELKDFLTFEEFDTFLNVLTPTEKMSITGWKAVFKAQVNTGAREGTTKKTGILSLKWEDINYQARRCRIHDKGTRANHGRLWQNVPLDLFSWLEGWRELMLWHLERYGYFPTNEKHAIGFVFPIIYQEYLNKFHATRKAAGGRLAEDQETLRLHIMRKTHAQYCAKLRIPVEWVCGQFPNGWFGVGWDSPQILLGYYMTLEAEERLEVEQKARQRMENLGLVSVITESVLNPLQRQANTEVKQ